MLFPTTIAGSLPKPEWLAEPNMLWAPWKAKGEELARAKRDATLLAVKVQEDAGIDILTEGEQARQHFVHGFLEKVDGIDFAHKVEMGIRKDRYKAMVPQVVAPLKLKGRVHADEARVARAHTARQLKFTLPGPMTIIDTLADSHYGDRVKMAFAFAELLNEEARALEADGINMIQFDEPAFNVFMDEVPVWGVKALERAAQGLKCATAVHICYGYGIKANVDWKGTLGSEWRQYEEIFPAIAESSIQQVAIECRNSKVPLDLLALLKGKKIQAGVIDVASDTVETAEDVCKVIDDVSKFVAAQRHHRHHQLRHGADAARHRRGQADGARRRRQAGAAAVRLMRLLRPALLLMIACGASASPALADPRDVLRDCEALLARAAEAKQAPINPAMPTSHAAARSCATGRCGNPACWSTSKAGRCARARCARMQHRPKSDASARTVDGGVISIRPPIERFHPSISGKAPTQRLAAGDQKALVPACTIVPSGSLLEPHRQRMQLLAACKRSRAGPRRYPAPADRRHDCPLPRARKRLASSRRQ